MQAGYRSDGFLDVQRQNIKATRPPALWFRFRSACSGCDLFTNGRDRPLIGVQCFDPFSRLAAQLNVRGGDQAICFVQWSPRRILPALRRSGLLVRAGVLQRYA